MTFSISKLWIIGLVSMSLSSVALADKAAVQKKLASLIPGGEKLPITESGVKGLYQVTVGAKIVYISADGQYVINGTIVNLDTRENLTEVALNNARQQLLKTIPVDSMIVYPAQGDTKRVITVFSDVDCPYCKKFHAEIPQLNQAGIEVRYLAYPRAGIGSDSFKKAISVWCNDKPAEAMNEVMKGKAIPSKYCENPVIDHMQLVERFGVTGTPNIIFDSGEMIPGYAPYQELIKMLIKS